MSNFIYSKDKIDQLVKQYDLPPVIMKGIREDLLRLKPIIEEQYDKHIFYLSYWENECGYHGWDLSGDDGKIAKMAKITDGITDRFLEIYALILSGLGECAE